MADRLMGWPLPKNFGPDCGITFTPHRWTHGPRAGEIMSWPVGTNLLTQEQAKEMFAYVLEGIDLEN